MSRLKKNPVIASLIWSHSVPFLLLGIVIILALWIPDAFDQTMSANRVGIRQYIRDMTAELQTTYLPDTAINRIVNAAHMATMLTLGATTNTDTDTIICSQGKTEYDIDANAIIGMVFGVSRRIETNQGGGDVGFIEIGPSQIGKVGEGVIPNSYAIRGNKLLLGTSPTGDDTLFVYYAPRANPLTADSSALSIAAEDQPALIFMAIAMTYFRDHQVQLGQAYWKMSQEMIAVKKPQPQAAQP